MDKTTFRNAENWRGPFYELAIRVPHGVSEAQLARAVDALWAQPQLHGIWQEPADFPDKPRSVAEIWSGYGFLFLPTGQEVGCHVFLLPEPDCDWLDLSIPRAMLEKVFPLVSPRPAHPNAGREEITPILVAIADNIYRDAAFDLGFIGEEVSGYTDANRVLREALGGCLLSPAFSDKLQVEEDGVILPSGLLWFPQHPLPTAA